MAKHSAAPPLRGTPAVLHGAAWLGTALPVSPEVLDPQIPAANHALVVLPKSRCPTHLCRRGQRGPGTPRSPPALSPLLCTALSLQICPVGKGFPSTGTNLFSLLPAPNSPQICRLRSAPGSARTSTAISLSALLYAMEIKLIRKRKGQKDLSARLVLSWSSWKGAGLP